MQLNKKTLSKIKTILFNYDLLNIKIKNKINSIYSNKPLKMNEKYLEKFALNFSVNEIDDIYLRLTQSNKLKPVIYFSMEYGISDLLPNYSGGLGILAGDHMKQSSESNIPIIAIGLLYRNGYFHQVISNYKQSEKYDLLKINRLASIKYNNKNQNLNIKVKTDRINIFAQVWELIIGKNKLYLLDTNIDENLDQNIKDLTDKLYGGDREKRFLQEILLGIGGMKLIYKLSLDYKGIHINEGHCAFALLERTRKLMKTGIDFNEAYQKVYNTSLFTTHTPVIHGNEEFDAELIQKYMKKYLKQFDLTPEDFVKINSIENSEKLMMTVLALNSAKYKNGVSKLHGETARQMWNNIDLKDSNISYITNGIHIGTWLNIDLNNVLLEQSGNSYQEKIENTDSETIINIRKRMKSELISYVNQRYNLGIENKEQIILTFARRFAPYKRAFLLFDAIHRLKRIFEHNNIIMFIAGKAHPEDVEGNEIIHNILTKISEFELSDRIFMLDNYDINLAKNLTSGSDIWLNTPLKPMEASGTSGMKSALNGGLNLSVLDGWWAEGYSGDNGFMINEFNAPERIKNEVENSYLMNELEYKVIPLFRDFTLNNKQLISYIKNSMVTIHDNFTSERMLKEYHEYYKKF